MHDITEASARVTAAVEELTRCLTAGEPEDEVARRNLDVMRALAMYRDAADRPETPAVLDWVPPIVEVEELADELRTDRIVHTATWVFSVADQTKVVRGGRSRLSATGCDTSSLRTSAEVVSALFDEELTWPDFQAYDELGLTLELVDATSQSLHPAD